MEPNDQSQELPDEKTDASDDLPHVFLDRYKIIEKIGRGGTGTVFKAQDLRLPRLIALKLLNSDKLSERNITRLHKEARTICQLQHTNIVDIYDFIVTAKGEPVLAMEYVNGVPLDNIIEESGAMSLRDSIDLFLQICDAMEYAHSRGVLHRDLAPSNILVNRNSKGRIQCKVVDFGIARVEDLQTTTVSKTGIMVGTVTVISPEQARGLRVDARSDVYSLGCLMYRTLTGIFPLQGDSILETVQLQLNEPAPTLAEGNPDCMYPQELEDVIARTLMKDPEERFQSMRALREALEEIFSAVDTNVTRVGSLSGINTAIISLRQPSGRKTTSRWIWLAPLAVIPLLFLTVLFVNYWHTDIDVPVNTKKDKLKERSYQLFAKNGQRWFRVHNKLSEECLPVLESNQQIYQRVEIKKVPVTSRELERLSKLPLEMIDLRDNETIDDESMKILAQCRSLRSILIRNNPKITDLGVRYLSRLPNLRILVLAGTSITNESIKILAGSKLSGLYLSNTNVDEQCVPWLLQMKGLKSLKLADTRISQAGVQKVLSVIPLWYIGLSGMNLHDQDFPPDMQRTFQMIDVSNNNLTGAVLGRFFMQPDLWYLDVRNNQISDDTRLFSKKNSHGVHIMMVYLESDNLEEMSTEGYLDPVCYDSLIKNPGAMRKLFMRWQSEKTIVGEE